MKNKIYYYRVWYDKCIINKKRNKNRYVAVYSINDRGQFIRHGESWANSASFKGEHSMAAQILTNKFGYKIDEGGYRLTEPNITLLTLP